MNTANLTLNEWHRVFEAAKAQGVAKPAYWQWMQRGKVPVKHVKPIAEATGISKRRLCPQVFA